MHTLHFKDVSKFQVMSNQNPCCKSISLSNVNLHGLLCLQLIARHTTYAFRHPHSQNITGRNVISHKTKEKCCITAAGMEAAGVDGADGVLVSATTGIVAGPSGGITDAWAVETEAQKLGPGDGMTASGIGLEQRVAAVPTASATGTATSCVRPIRRNCTRQVAHVVRYLSATDRHNARRRVQGGVC